jgi:hypothetical protein
MTDYISLAKIISSVLDEKGLNVIDSETKSLERQFYRLLTKLGGNKDELKNAGGNFAFGKMEIPFFKIIIKSLYNRDGIISKLITDKEEISSSDIYVFITELLEEAEKSKMDEKEVADLLIFLIDLFPLAYTYYYEQCLLYIDMLDKNIQELPSTYKAAYMAKLADTIKKGVSLHIAESAIDILTMANDIIILRQNCEDNSDNESDRHSGASKSCIYTQSDKLLIKKIIEDDALRQYLKNKTGLYPEQIFGNIQL